MFVQRIQELMASLERDKHLQIALWAAREAEMHELAERQIWAIQSDYYKKLHATMFCKPCERQSTFAALGFEKDNPPGSRAHEMFALGYSAEVLTIAQLLVLGYNLNYQDSYSIPDWYAGDLDAIYCHPDAVITLTKLQQNQFFEEYGWMPGVKVAVEIKSTNPRTFETMVEKGVEGARPGYYDQATVEMASIGRNTLVWIVVERASGKLLENAVTFSGDHFAKLTERFHRVVNAKTPFDAAGIDRVPATKYEPGKDPPEDARRDPKTTLYTLGGYPCKARVNTKGHIYGWDRQIGWTIPQWPCQYCGWRGTCWADSGCALVWAKTNGKNRLMLEKKGP